MATLAHWKHLWAFVSYCNSCFRQVVGGCLGPCNVLLLTVGQVSCTWYLIDGCAIIIICIARRLF
jgi:hypothetical protein